MSKMDWIFGDKDVTRYFRALPDGVRSKVIDSVGRLTLRLQARVMKEKLTGQVLKVRTGTLRRSIDRVLLTDQKYVVGIVSTNVSYGKAHEYGGLQTQTVREHLRLVKKAFRKDLKSPVWSTVRSHSRTVNLPERSFLRSALAEMQDDVVADVEKAVADGIHGK